ncbi:family 9 glycosyl transferase [Melioribacter roseus P3M-2]|uniref:Family 9 glycosyl transferase n=1 Tax=Melioribacter roseus (strain DSM 23840 / JCM 17771 / VKM B-2668 / P3M-2) TaxID=1191523 RepID=I7A3C5_MELRP|nr:glycosyltransferase family 9 protein [Melioribacter roseus]AFN75723.1 family 9 glycosyl transferase [Melioribacter roseus P3M-2]
MKKIEILLRKFLLNLFLLLKRKEKTRTAPNLNGNSNVVIIRLNRIGDALTSTPFIRLLKKHCDCNITVVCSKSNHFIFRQNGLTDNLIVYDKKQNNLAKIIRAISDINPDLLIDLHDDVSFTVSMLIAFSSAKCKMGFDKKNNKLFNARVPRPDSKIHHIVDRNLAFADSLGIDYGKDEVNIVYKPDANSVALVENFISKHGLKKKFLTGINISAGSDARFWGVERYGKLIDFLSNTFDTKVILLTDKKDMKKAEEISKGKILIFQDDKFDVFAAMVGSLDFLITPDTSIVHIASAFEIPLFGLYVKYKTDDIIWYPYKSEYEVVITENPDLSSVDYETVVNKLKPFFERIYHEKNT